MSEQDVKITYTTMDLGQAEAFNRAYDAALDDVMSRLNETYPAYINGQPRTFDAAPFESLSPNDTSLVLGRFQECGAEVVAEAVLAARAAFPAWSALPWQRRVEIMRAAADNFRDRKYELGAWLAIEAGKGRLEAMGEVEEAADLITTYCEEMEANHGFVRKLGQLDPAEVNFSVCKPYGVWAVIAPFNFPVALATGMLAGALVSGNTAVFKPSIETPLAGVLVYRCLADAGLPNGVLNLVTGSGNETGEAMSRNPDVDGIAFTGSKAVGTRVFSDFSRERPKPCITEMGGKNPVIVTDSADLDKAVEGTVRAAFGYSGQKCSAASRAYVFEGVYDEFVRRVVARTGELTVGNPTEADVFMGPVINARAYERFQQSVATAQQDGRVLIGGNTLTEGKLAAGFYCAPTVVELPSDHAFFYEELFIPLIAITRVSSLDEALERANDSEYGLTAGIFTEREDEKRAFLDAIEAGVVYVNRRGGATTGAWPGIQSFGGWKASGSTGMHALGPYYVQQFLHEQSQTVVGA